MEFPLRFLSLRVGAISLGVDANRIKRVLPAFALLPAPGGPEILLGIADVEGTLVPAADTRFRLGQGRTTLDPGHIFVLARAGKRTLILIADAVIGFVDAATSRFTPKESLAPVLPSLKGVVQDETGALWVQDLDGFLSWEEEGAIQASLEREEVRLRSSGLP